MLSTHVGHLPPAISVWLLWAMNASVGRSTSNWQRWASFAFYVMQDYFTAIRRWWWRSFSDQEKIPIFTGREERLKVRSGHNSCICYYRLLFNFTIGMLSSHLYIYFYSLGLICVTWDVAHASGFGKVEACLYIQSQHILNGMKGMSRRVTFKLTFDLAVLCRNDTIMII